MLIEPLRIHIRYSFFSFPSDLMKSTVVDESLSTNATRVLFQRKTTFLLYDFQIFYKTGMSNVEADALSHILWEVTEEEENLENVVVKAILAGCSINKALYESYIGYLIEDKESLIGSVAWEWLVMK